MVEEEERYKLLKKSTVTRESLRSVYFEYQNRSVKMVMLPVAIAQNNHIHDFFTIFISGVTGIPSRDCRCTSGPTSKTFLSTDWSPQRR